jgi:hypothetical protein
MKKKIILVALTCVGVFIVLSLYFPNHSVENSNLTLKLLEARAQCDEEGTVSGGGITGTVWGKATPSCWTCGYYDQNGEEVITGGGCDCYPATEGTCTEYSWGHC